MLSRLSVAVPVCNVFRIKDESFVLYREGSGFVWIGWAVIRPSYIPLVVFLTLKHDECSSGFHVASIHPLFQLICLSVFSSTILLICSFFFAVRVLRYKMEDSLGFFSVRICGWPNFVPGITRCACVPSCLGLDIESFVTLARFSNTII